jgi:hypothetical protein
MDIASPPDCWADSGPGSGASSYRMTDSKPHVQRLVDEVINAPYLDVLDDIATARLAAGWRRGSTRRAGPAGSAGSTLTCSGCCEPSCTTMFDKRFQLWEGEQATLLTVGQKLLAGALVGTVREGSLPLALWGNDRVGPGRPR